MFTQRFILEAKGADDRMYRLSVPSDAPLGEIHDVLFTFKSIIVNQIAELDKKENQEVAEKSAKEEEYKKEISQLTSPDKDACEASYASAAEMKILPGSLPVEDDAVAEVKKEIEEKNGE